MFGAEIDRAVVMRRCGPQQVLLALIATTLIVAAACTKAPPQPLAVRSSDGVVTLRIPAQALPAGTSPANVAITRVAGAEGGRLGLYRLEPDGLALTLPVSVEIDATALAPLAAPLVIHHSASGAEALDTKIEMVGGRVTNLTAEIAHFSLIEVRSGGFMMQTMPVTDKHLFDPFLVVFRLGVDPAQDNATVGEGANQMRQQFGGIVTLANGTFSSRHATSVRPRTVPNRPRLATFAKSVGHSTQGRFECGEAAQGVRIRYWAQLSAEVTYTTLTTPPRTTTSTNTHQIQLDTNPFDCLAGVAPPPATPQIATGQATTAGNVFDLTLEQRPTGNIPVGSDVTINIRVRRNAAATAPGSPQAANWHIFHGELEQVGIYFGGYPLSPSRIAPLPRRVTRSSRGIWETQAIFRCLRSGVSRIEYHAALSVPLVDPAAAGRNGGRISASARVVCAGATPAGGVIPLLEPAIAGPFESGTRPPGSVTAYGWFQARMWREPGGDLVVGQQVQVTTEVENLLVWTTLANAAGNYPQWGLAGSLTQPNGNALTPRAFRNNAPAWNTPTAALGTWSQTYTFTCQRPERVIQLRHDLTLLLPRNATEIAANGTRDRFDVASDLFSCIGE